MQTALTTNTPEAIGSYFSLYRELLTAQHYVCKNTGNLIHLTSEKKIIWCWMIDRYTFFKDQNKEFFDNQTDIAAACGVSVSTVKRFLAELTDAVNEDGKPLGAGYIKTTQTRSIGGHKSNSYVLLSDLVLMQPEKTPNKPVAAKAEQTNTIAAPALQIAIEELTEPYGDSHIPAGESFATECIPYDDDEPLWFVDSVVDDGSVYDALTFTEEKIVKEITTKNNDQAKYIPLPAPEQEHNFSSDFVKELPEKRFKPNGQVSTEMLSYCKALDILIRTSVQGDTIFIVNGKECCIGADGFVPYVATARFSAPLNIPVSNDDPWSHISSPF